MSRTFPPSGRALRATVCAALALLAALIAAVTLSPRADAAFSTQQCQGADILGRGASFARDAHTSFRTFFESTFCTSAGRFPAVTYDAAGSGAGRRAVGERTGSNADGSQSRALGGPRFGMTDEPPSPGGANEIERGTGTASDGDESEAHVIPAAVGGVAPLVNFPDGCDVNQLDAANKTSEQDLDADTIPDDVVRVKFTKTKFEAAWAQDAGALTWTQLFPELTGIAACEKPIVRVVRFDDSGTTFAFKDYLDTIDPAEGWLTTYASGPNKTIEWPNATVGGRTDCAGASGPGAPGAPADPDQLTSGCSNGNGSLVSKLSNNTTTDGSIGYSDISTARTAGLAITPEGNDNDIYWTQVPNGQGCASTANCQTGAFAEPTSDPNGFRTDGAKGSNCQQATFDGIPISTLGDWSSASGINSPNGYGVCTLTYGILFDDYAKAYAKLTDQAGEERKARTVKDYWTAIVSDGAQGRLSGADYSPLPADILGISRAGVNAVGWDKSATGGGGSTPPPSGGSTPPPTGGGSTPPPPVATPSNRFSILRNTINSRRGTATISVRVPGRGTIQAVATARRNGRRFRVGGVRIGVTRAGAYRLTIKPGRTAKRILNRARRLRTTVRVSYKPTGGTTSSVNRTVTLKLRRGARAR